MPPAFRYRRSLAASANDANIGFAFLSGPQGRAFTHARRAAIDAAVCCRAHEPPNPSIEDYWHASHVGSVMRHALGAGSSSARGAALSLGVLPPLL